MASPRFEADGPTTDSVESKRQQAHTRRHTIHHSHNRVTLFATSIEVQTRYA